MFKSIFSLDPCPIRMEVDVGGYSQVLCFEKNVIAGVITSFGYNYALFNFMSSLHLTLLRISPVTFGSVKAAAGCSNRGCGLACCRHLPA